MSKRRFYKLLFSLLATVILYAISTQTNLLSSSAQVAQQKQPGLYPISKFIDGDTIEVNMNGYTETIRMIGMDTPETHKPNTPIQCYGPEAAAYTKALIGNNAVRLQADPLDTNRDRYGRLLRYVYLPDGTLLEQKLVSEGYALAYLAFPFERKADFATWEEQAKAANKGLWAHCQIITESNGARHTNPQ
jgi:micrococcal nuclease